MPEGAFVGRELTHRWRNPVSLFGFSTDQGPHLDAGSLASLVAPGPLFSLLHAPLLLHLLSSFPFSLRRRLYPALLNGTFVQ